MLKVVIISKILLSRINFFFNIISKNSLKSITNRQILKKNYTFILNENTEFSLIFKIILIELFKRIKVNNVYLK